MNRKTRDTCIKATVSLLLVGLIVGGGVYAWQQFHKTMEVVEAIKISDACFHSWLYQIQLAIKEYQSEHEGANPPDMEVLYEQYGLRKFPCEYIYRGSDLREDSPAKLILVYDKFGNHEGYRNVLFGGEVEIYKIGYRVVTKEHYFAECVKLLVEADVKDMSVLFEEKGAHFSGAAGRYAINFEEVSSEDFQAQFEAARQQYIAGEMPAASVNISVKDIDSDRLIEVKVEQGQVCAIREEDLEAFIERDNELRRGLGLAEKEINK